MLRENVLKINSLTNSIIQLQNKITRINEKLESEYEFTHHEKQIETFGFYGNTLDLYSMNEIIGKMKFHDKDNNIKVTIEHTTENVDPYENYETDVTNVAIYADIMFSEQEIEDYRNIKLAEIETLKCEINRLENELKGLVA